MSASKAASFNFSRVSGRDYFAFGSSRPGFPSKDVTSEAVDEWVAYVKGQSITRVLSLLGDDEKGYYKDMDIDNVMTEAFGEGNYTRVSVFSPDARDVMKNAMNSARKAGAAIVIHCSGGEGRAAIGMGLWLVALYGLLPEEAAKELEEETEKNADVVRKISAAKLEYLITNGTMQGFQK